MAVIFTTCRPRQRRRRRSYRRRKWNRYRTYRQYRHRRLPTWLWPRPRPASLGWLPPCRRSLRPRSREALLPRWQVRPGRCLRWRRPSTRSARLSSNEGDTRSSDLYQKREPNRTHYAALFRARFWYQKLSNTADQSNRTILVTCVGALEAQASDTSFLHNFLERVSPLQVSVSVCLSVSLSCYLVIVEIICYY